MNRRRGGTSEEGSAAIEAAIGVPAFMMLVLLIICGARVAIAHQAVQSAAADAARTASIARTEGQAQSDGTTSAASTLSAQGLHCITQQVRVDASGFATSVGTPAMIRATVRCTVDLSDVSIPGIPGTLTISKTMSSPLDTYRER